MKLLVDGIRSIERALSECVELLFGETKFVGQVLQLMVAFFELGELIIERFQGVFDRLAETWSERAGREKCTFLLGLTFD